ncbi:hypothetical protein B566_EDAN017773, partial [Ephemera danica]
MDCKIYINNRDKMALEYMIGVYNRYANLLDDTEDPEIMSALQVAEKKLDVLAKQAKTVPIDQNKEKRQAKPKKNDDAQKKAAPPPAAIADKARKVTDDFANQRKAAEQEYLKRSGKLNRAKVFYRGGGHAADRSGSAGVEYDRHSNSLH